MESMIGTNEKVFIIGDIFLVKWIV